VFSYDTSVSAISTDTTGDRIANYLANLVRLGATTLNYVHLIGKAVMLLFLSL